MSGPSPSICKAYWGSHACSLPDDHVGQHFCQTDCLTPSEYLQRGYTWMTCRHGRTFEPCPMEGGIR